MIAGYAALERQAGMLSREIRALKQERQVAHAPRRSVVDLATDLGIALDPWQRDALITPKHDILLLVSRQGGKGTVASLLALAGLLFDPGSTTIIVSKTDRQAKRLMRRVRRLYRSLANVPPPVVDSLFALELRNGSECLALPGSEENIRGIEAVDLLVLDEAAVVPDELYFSTRPMLAVSNGRCIALTTPRGKRGWFYSEWTAGGEDWHRAKVTADEIPRIKPAWLEKERRRLGPFWFAQEYGCEFMEAEDQLFRNADIEAALDPSLAPLFGGLDHAA